MKEYVQTTIPKELAAELEPAWQGQRRRPYEIQVPVPHPAVEGPAPGFVYLRLSLYQARKLAHALGFYSHGGGWICRSDHSHGCCTSSHIVCQGWSTWLASRQRAVLAALIRLGWERQGRALCLSPRCTREPAFDGPYCLECDELSAQRVRQEARQ